MAKKKKTANPVLETRAVEARIQSQSERPWWHSFVAKMTSKVKEDEWPMPAKRTKKKEGNTTIWTETIKPPIKIADMHPARLDNTIKWCVLMVQREMTRSPYIYMGTTKAELLATLPQWATLLQTAKQKRVFRITKGWCSKCGADWVSGALCECELAATDCAEWYQECAKALGMKILED